MKKKGGSVKRSQRNAGLEFNQTKTNILVKGISADAACAAAQRIIAQDPTLTHLAPHIQDKIFSAEGYVGLGVPGPRH